MQTHDETSDPAPQPVSRLGLYLPVSLLLAVAAAWCGFWFYSANLAETSLTRILANEAAHGRDWTCADQKIEGFPFRIELHCASVSLTTTQDGRSTRVTTGALHAATQIYAPKLALADVDGPLAIEADGARTTATWDSLRLSVRFSNSLDRLSIAVTGPRVSTAQAGVETAIGSAKYAEVHVRADSGRPVEDRALDLAIQMNEASSPLLDQVIGSTDKMNLDVSGVATKLSDAPVKSLRSLLDFWRDAGGTFVVESSKLAKGALQVESTGTLNLDAARRLQGKLDVSAKGLAPLIARFGGGGLTQMIGPLLTRKDGTPVRWPVQLQDGRVQIGPLRTGPILGSLY